MPNRRFGVQPFIMTVGEGRHRRISRGVQSEVNRMIGVLLVVSILAFWIALQYKGTGQ